MRSVAVVLAIGCSLVMGAVMGAVPAAAAPAEQTFTCRAGKQVVNVPADVTTMHFVVTGGQGGGSFRRGHDEDGLGGTGARLTGTWPVGGGEALTVYAGCSGGVDPNTGYAGGGARGTASESTMNDGTSGGAASALMIGPAGQDPTTTVAIAGGGGGGGGAPSGTGGAAAPQEPSQGNGGAPEGGTVGSMPGGYGGNGENSHVSDGGGGGGGGVRGGGGGGSVILEGGGGGGAGTSVTDPRVVDPTMTTRTFKDSGPAGNGYVTVTFS